MSLNTYSNTQLSIVQLNQFLEGVEQLNAVVDKTAMVLAGLEKPAQRDAKFKDAIAQFNNQTQDSTESLLNLVTILTEHSTRLDRYMNILTAQVANIDDDITHLVQQRREKMSQVTAAVLSDLTDFAVKEKELFEQGTKSLKIQNLGLVIHHLEKLDGLNEGIGQLNKDMKGLMMQQTKVLEQVSKSMAIQSEQSVALVNSLNELHNTEGEGWDFLRKPSSLLFTVALVFLLFFSGMSMYALWQLYKHGVLHL